MDEAWKPVVGFEGLYEVSNTGKVRSVDRIVPSRWPCGAKMRGVMLTPQTSHKGYKTVVLHKNNQYHQKQVHRLVAEAFIENPDGLPQVNHIDTDKANNNVSNLEWISGTDNMRHAFKNGCFKFTDNQRNALREKQRLSVKSRIRPVVAIDPEDLSFVAVFRSTSDAERILGQKSIKVTQVINGKRNVSGNFKWKYLEDVINERCNNDGTLDKRSDD